MVPPCFTPASRQGPYGVQSYSCALTGAPVAACAYLRSRCAAPRPSSPKPSVPVPTNPGSLCRILTVTLLFLAFEGRYSVPFGLHLVYATHTHPVKRLFCTKEPGRAVSFCTSRPNLSLIGSQPPPASGFSAFSGRYPAGACRCGWWPGSRWTGKSAPGSPAPPRTPTG